MREIIRISVIIPAYNAENTIQRCLESIWKQRQKDYEIIVVDDGSQDNTLGVIRHLSEGKDNFKVISVPNGGVSRARNKGLEVAEGEWITFIDSDDYIDEDYFPEDISLEYDLILQNWSYSNREGGDVFHAACYKDEACVRFVNDNICRTCFRGVLSKFYRRDIIEKYKIRYPEGIRLCEDTLFVLHYLIYSKSLVTLGGGCYRYELSENWINKYKLSLEEAFLLIESFYGLWEMMDNPPIRLLHFMLSYVPVKIENFSNWVIKIKWYQNNTVLNAMGTQLECQSWRFRMYYYILKVLYLFRSVVKVYV